MERLWGFLKNKRNRDILSWFGGGIVAIATGAWVLFGYFYDREPPQGDGDSDPQSLSQELPTGEEFRALIRACAASLEISFASDLIDRTVEIYGQDIHDASGQIEDLNRFLAQFPPEDRLTAYQLYIACVQSILSNS